MRFYREFYLAGLGIALFAVSATAGTLTVGFEAPYTAGNINGQQGWSNTGNYDAAVSSGGAFGGSQSLRISNGIASGSFGDQTFTPHLAVPAGESTVPGAVDEFLSSWYFKSVTGSLQDGLGISVSADNGAGARMSWVRMQEDSVNGLNLQFADYSRSQENWVYTTLATNIDRSAWHRVDMNIYFVDGPSNDVVTVYLDGRLMITGTTWEDFQTRDPRLGDGGGLGLAPVNSLLFRAGGDPVPATLGKGFYIDDVSLTSQTPEPGTVGLLLTGILGLVAVAERRRLTRD
jgi:hypothetical protein